MAKHIHLQPNERIELEQGTNAEDQLARSAKSNGAI
jgi:hypothetical protein